MRGELGLEAMKAEAWRQARELNRPWKIWLTVKIVLLLAGVPAAIAVAAFFVRQ